MVVVAQLVRAPACDAGCRRFETDFPPLLIIGDSVVLGFNSHCVTHGLHGNHY